jgi:hypothetical protein
MTIPIRRRSLPDQIRYMARKLREDPSKWEYISIALESMAELQDLREGKYNEAVPGGTDEGHQGQQQGGIQ